MNENEKERMKGMKKVKENIVRDVKKKEIKKSEGEAANEIKELIKKEMEELRLEMNAQNEVMKMELKEIKESVVKGMCDEFKKMCEEIKKNMLEEMEKMRGDVMEKVINLSSEVNKVKEEMEEQKKSVEFVSEAFEEMKEENALIRKELKEKEIAYGKNDVIEAKIHQLENKLLQNNLEISGLPCRPDENCHLMAFNVIRNVCPEVNQKDIEYAHRIGNPWDKEGNPRKYRPIVAKIKDINIRNKIFINKKKTKDIDTVVAGLSEEKEKVYINEHLSAETKQLFGKANSARKAKGWSYIWTRFGVILLRKSDKSQVVPIHSATDLIKIK